MNEVVFGHDVSAAVPQTQLLALDFPTGAAIQVLGYLEIATSAAVAGSIRMTVRWTDRRNRARSRSSSALVLTAGTDAFIELSALLYLSEGRNKQISYEIDHPIAPVGAFTYNYWLEARLVALGLGGSPRFAARVRPSR